MRWLLKTKELGTRRQAAACQAEHERVTAYTFCRVDSFTSL
jgi:hypothetical protein